MSLDGEEDGEVDLDEVEAGVEDSEEVGAEDSVLAAVFLAEVDSMVVEEA
jgi:hypothetical protein